MISYTTLYETRENVLLHMKHWAQKPQDTSVFHVPHHTGLTSLIKRVKRAGEVSAKRPLQGYLSTRYSIHTAPEPSYGAKVHGSRNQVVEAALAFLASLPVDMPDFSFMFLPPWIPLDQCLGTQRGMLSQGLW